MTNPAVGIHSVNVLQLLIVLCWFFPYWALVTQCLLIHATIPNALLLIYTDRLGAAFLAIYAYHVSLIILIGIHSILWEHVYSKITYYDKDSDWSSCMLLETSVMYYIVKARWIFFLVINFLSQNLFKGGCKLLCGDPNISQFCMSCLSNRIALLPILGIFLVSGVLINLRSRHCDST